MCTQIVSREKLTLKVKVLFKRDLLSKCECELESGRERAVRDNRYIAVFMINNVSVVSSFFLREGGNVGAESNEGYV